MDAWGFETGLALRQRAAGATASPPAASTITALVVQGAAVLPDGANAAVPNGWVAKATMPWNAAASFDPTKIVLTVEDPGFDGSGTTTRTRTIRGGAVIRKQYSLQAQRLSSQVSTNLEVYFSLTDWVYAGSTITAATAEPAYYGAAASGSIAGVVNSSALAYPKPLAAWLNIPHERATGSGFAIELAAYHRHAMLGRQVARVEFIGKDAQGTPNVAATQTAALPALSDLQVKGQRAEAYKATIPLSALTQGDLCQVNAKVYPWIGDAAAVLDLAVDGTAWGTNGTAQPQTPLRFLNDKTGGYGGGQAWVRAGASGGTVGSSSTPYPTIAAAITALRTWNNINKGHNDHSGSTIFLMDNGSGGAVAHVTADFDAVAAGKCWTDIKADPGATGAVSVSLTATLYTCDLTRWMVPIVQTSGRFDGYYYAGWRLALDGSSLDVNGFAAPINYGYTLTYYRNLTVTGVDGGNGDPFYSYFAGTKTIAAMILGCVDTTATGDGKAVAGMMVGNNFRRRVFDEYLPSSYVNIEQLDGRVVANNLLLATRQPCFAGGSIPIVKGLALVQNVIERAVQANSVPALQIGGDNSAAPIANVGMQHNTLPGVDQGSRANLLYNDGVATIGVSKTGSVRFNLFHQYNVKTDTFTGTTTLTGRTGNWAIRYAVGNIGNVVTAGDTGGATAPDQSGGNWLGEHWEPGSSPSAGAIAFSDNRSGTVGAGGGVYSLTGASSAAYARVPSGHSALGYDIAGVARRTNGTGAAGAYERP